jgi:hypothetical protein
MGAQSGSTLLRVGPECGSPTKELALGVVDRPALLAIVVLADDTSCGVCKAVYR